MRIPGIPCLLAIPLLCASCGHRLSEVERDRVRIEDLADDDRAIIQQLIDTHRISALYLNRNAAGDLLLCGDPAGNGGVAELGVNVWVIDRDQSGAYAINMPPTRSVWIHDYEEPRQP